MPVFAMSLSGFSSSSTITSQDIFSIGYESKMARVAASAIIAEMVNYRYISAFSSRYGSNKPRINKSMCPVANLVNSDTTVPVNSSASPIPATCNVVNINLRKEPTDSFSSDFHTPIVSQGGHNAK